MFQIVGLENKLGLMTLHISRNTDDTNTNNESEPEFTKPGT